MAKSKGKFFTDTGLRFFILGYLMSGQRTLEDIHQALYTTFRLYIIDRPDEEALSDFDLLLPILRILDVLTDGDFVTSKRVEVSSTENNLPKFFITLYRISDSIMSGD